MATPKEGVRSLRWPRREHCERLADGLAAALAALLPWSTSAVGILAVLWLIAAIPAIDARSLRRAMLTPAGGIPVLLVTLALLGMLWAVDSTMAERVDGIGSFVKLLFIPLFMAHFSKSERGWWVVAAFLVSCSILLAVSWTLVLWPGFAAVWPFGKHAQAGWPVRDYIAQAGEFTVCIFLLAKLAWDDWLKARRWRAVGWALPAVPCLANILYVSPSRTGLVILPILALLFVFVFLPKKASIVAAVGVALVVAFVGWLSPPSVTRFVEIEQEVREYSRQGPETSAGLRLQFWREAAGIVATAPLFGHGTGSIREQYRKAAAGRTGVAGVATTNPHNQTFAVAIQLGIVGTAILLAMWIAHLLVFRGRDFLAWAGLVIVVQNVVGSLFNSHLFDFVQGWGYVIGVGVAAGMVLKKAGQGERPAADAGHGAGGDPQ